MDDKPPSRPRRPLRVAQVAATAVRPTLTLLTINLVALASAQAQGDVASSLGGEVGVGRLLETLRVGSEGSHVFVRAAIPEQELNPLLHRLQNVLNIAGGAAAAGL